VAYLRSCFGRCYAVGGQRTGLFARPRRIAALADRDIVEREHCALTGIPGPDQTNRRQTNIGRGCAPMAISILSGNIWGAEVGLFLPPITHGPRYQS
jgi:hypothetical protein